jgi:hypothetical protein
MVYTKGHRHCKRSYSHVAFRAARKNKLNTAKTCSNLSLSL